jgi:5-formyltetrahydrofolate cyclo-ligase
MRPRPVSGQLLVDAAFYEDHMPKHVLRQDLLTRRRTMRLSSWQAASTAAQERLIKLDPFRLARCIVLYSPVQQEIGTDLLFAAANADGKTILYPAVSGNSLRFQRVTRLEQLVSGSFGILEPCCSAEDRALDEADLIVVPGVAFDLRGHRIGFGKGYYDRCLSRLSGAPVVAGICHDFQLLDHIPAEGHDIRMQYVVTDKRLIIPQGEQSRNRPYVGLT